MLIKINQGRFAQLINPDFISRITIYAGEQGVTIFMNGDEEGVSVDQDEWLRILPLLNIPAPVAAVPAPSPAYYALYDAYKQSEDASNWQDVGLMLYPHVAYFLTGITPKMPKSNQDQYNRGLYPTGPIVDAYHQYMKWLQEDKHESEYDMRNAVIDAVRDAMPVSEESDE